MSGDSSEEKSLPPSERKLQESRKKGQIAKSQDMVTAISMLFLVIYLVLGWPLIFAAFARMFDTAGLAAAQGGKQIWGPAINDTWSAAGTILGPLYIVSIFAIFLGSVVSNKGILFSMEAVKPDLKKIHPGEGFKKIFSLRNTVEFLKGLLKSMLLLLALGIAGWLGFQKMMQAPLCRDECGQEILLLVISPLVFAALALFMASAAIDMILQKWMFSRDMRMSHSEMKREMKDIYGDPNVRRARNEIRRGIATGNQGGKAVGYLKDKTPTLVVISGNHIAIGLRYVAGETPAPVVVFKATGARAGMLIQQSVSAGIKVTTDAQLAEALVQKAKADGFVPEALFRDVANAMSQ